MSPFIRNSCLLLWLFVLLSAAVPNTQALCNDADCGQEGKKRGLEGETWQNHKLQKVEVDEEFVDRWDEEEDDVDYLYDDDDEDWDEDEVEVDDEGFEALDDDDYDWDEDEALDDDYYGWDDVEDEDWDYDEDEALDDDDEDAE
jgi:hypothetical protein